MKFPSVCWGNAATLKQITYLSYPESHTAFELFESKIARCWFSVSAEPVNGEPYLIGRAISHSSYRTGLGGSEATPVRSNPNDLVSTL